MKTIFGVHLLGRGDEARMSDIVGDINQEKFVREANKIRIPINRKRNVNSCKFHFSNFKVFLLKYYPSRSTICRSYDKY